jgi:large subunit ribosomal protein L18
MKILVNKSAERKRRHMRIRKRIMGTTERPRLAIYRSNQHIYAQIIDDQKGVTLTSASTLEQDVRKAGVTSNNIETARVIGERIAKKAVEAGISQVVFDRGGNKYHGRVAALAEAARENGLQF